MQLRQSSKGLASQKIAGGRVICVYGRRKYPPKPINTIAEKYCRFFMKFPTSYKVHLNIRDNFDTVQEEALCRFYHSIKSNVLYIKVSFSRYIRSLGNY